MKDLNKFREDLKDAIEVIDRELKSAPEGSLARRGSYAIHMIHGKSTGITNEVERIRKLCRKKLNITRKRKIKRCLEVLEYPLTKIHDTSMRETVDSLPPTYKDFGEKFFYHPNFQLWIEEDFETNNFRDEEIKYISNNGVVVRSKSELIIANLLEKLGYFYRYEAALWINGKKIFPDFTIMNPWTGEIYYIEHFGALHIDKYVNYMLQKMRIYRQNGITNVNKILFTFEPCIEDPVHLENLIVNFLNF